MGSSMSSVYKRAFGKQETRIIMLGLDAAGKTTILYKMQLGEVKTTIPTIGFNVETMEMARKKSAVSFTAWDVGGRCAIRPLWRHYYKEANCAVFVVDSNDRDRVEVVHDELHRLLSEEEVRDFPLLVFANKQDLPNAMTGAELTERLGLNKLRNRQWYLQESCALTGEGLVDGLEWLSAILHSDQKAFADRPLDQKAFADSQPQEKCEVASNADTDSTADTEALDMDGQTNLT